MNRFLLAMIGAFVFAGCAMPISSSATQVRDADESIGAGWTYLGDVDGTSGWGNLAASTGAENANREAREKVAKLGATHVVWRQVAGGYSPSVSGRAYRSPGD
ncbi:MAG: hypothetical protein H7Z14_14645 [Anaerolineae bacterium]|nr:hypothetical protein [Phycisphaerae bacterium]